MVDHYGRSSRSFIATRSGFGNGLLVTIFDGLFNEPRQNFFGMNGLQIKVHNKSVKPDLTEGVIASPGFASFLRVKKIFISDLTEPFNDCIDTLDTYHSFDSKLYKEMIKN